MTVGGPLEGGIERSAAVVATDADLARRFAEGRVGAVRDLYDRFAGPVLTVTMGHLGDRSLAEEAVQETFVKAWRSSATFDAERRLSPWLYVIARRVASDIRRRESRRPRSVTTPSALTPAEDETTFDQAWEAWEVRRALGELPVDEREVIRLTHYAGLTQLEVADRLGVPVGTVKSRAHRAHRRLAQRLAHLTGSNA